MKNTLVIVDPDYQFGFQGFLKECNNSGIVVAIGNNKQEFGINIKSSSAWLSQYISRSAIWVPSYAQLKDIIKTHNIKNIHVVGEPTYLSVFIVCLIKYFNKNLSLSISCRAAQNLEFKLPILFKFTLKFARYSKVKVFPVSQLSSKFTKNFYKLNVFPVLPNGVPAEFFCKREKTTERNIVLFVGHFIERKGFSDFLSVCRSINEIYGSKYRFVAVGGKNIDKNHKGLRVNYPEIKFIERVPREELISIYDDALCLIMPSKYTDGKDLPLIKRLFKTVPWSEQFGRVIVESYSRGTPVIAYDSGAIGEYLLDKKLLIKEGDAKGLINAFIELSNSKINQLDYIRYSQKYKWSEVFKNFLEHRIKL